MGITPYLISWSLDQIPSITFESYKDHGDRLEGITERLGNISHTGNMDLGVIAMNRASKTEKDPLRVTERHSRQEIKQMLLRRRVRQTQPVYWRKLVEVGVPLHAADIISKAIAQYDAVRQVPSSQQKHLINEYCRFICRADLWRSQLLMSHAS